MATQYSPSPSLTEQVSDTQPLNPSMEDDAWIEVIQRMDVIYADLVNSQVALEEKNADILAFIRLTIILVLLTFEKIKQHYFTWRVYVRFFFN